MLNLYLCPRKRKINKQINKQTSCRTESLQNCSEVTPALVFFDEFYEIFKITFLNRTSHGDCFFTIWNTGKIIALFMAYLSYCGLIIEKNSVQWFEYFVCKIWPDRLVFIVCVVGVFYFFI